MLNGLRLKNLFLRLLPYLMAIIAGWIVYVVSNATVKDVNLSGLLLNIAAGLLSIPLVFIFYELVNEVVSRNIHISIKKSLVFEINSAIIAIIKNLQTMLTIRTPIDKNNLNKLLNKNKEYIKNNLQTKSENGKSFEQSKEKLLNLTHNNPNLNVLSIQQIKAMMAIIKDLSILSKEIEHNNNGKNKEFIEKNIFELLKDIKKWINYGEEDAIINHHSFELM